MEQPSHHSTTAAVRMEIRNIFFACIVILLIFSSRSLSQSEFPINTTTGSAQRDAQIAMDSDGSYAVVWKSDRQTDSLSAGDIVLQFFSASDQPIGSEVVVNTVTARDQDKPSIAMNANGELLVTWASYTGFQSIYDIKGRIFKDRSPIGPEFTVNTTVNATQTNPDADAASNGTFVIVWDSWDQDGSDKGVYGRTLSGNGIFLTGEFPVNTTTAYSQAKPSVRTFTNGTFVVVWESWKQDESSPAGYGVYARLFNADGTGASSELRVNTFIADYQWYADVETFSDNSFAVVWCSWEQDGYDGSIYFQRFTSSGVKTGGEIPVNQTVVDYQWLPKIKVVGDDSFAVIWSSWKQDGDREGIYARLFSNDGRALSMETRVNDYRTNFQWEPDLAVTPDNKILAVWSSWGKNNSDYEIAAKRFTLPLLQGYFNPSGYQHTVGTSTTKFIVHRLDSTTLTGHQYEMRFDSIGNVSYRAVIVDLTDGDTVVPNFLITRGEKTFYLTEQFDGAAVEIRPELDLELDLQNSYFRKNTGTNALLTLTNPTVGVKLVAPIDITVVWGTPDTNALGQFTTPTDTAINVAGQRVVMIPFKAVNITDGKKVDVLVVDGNNNKRFDFGERIILLTPLPYRKAANNTHCQLTNSFPSVNGVWPAAGDTMFILTTRPLTKNDRFRFTTSPGNILSAGRTSPMTASTFRLEQNYPNPFNPSTTIIYTVDRPGRVRLSISNILGQRIAVPIDEYHSEGRYRMNFHSQDLAAGVYFYTVESDRRMITKKMLLVK